MKITCEKKPKSMVHIILIIPTDEHEPFLKSAAEEIGKKLKVNGFRPGHIPFDVVQKEAGEMAVLELASESMIKKGLLQAIKENNLETIGQPNVTVKKLVPNNDVEVEVDWAHIPSVELPDIEKIKIKENTVEASDEDVSKTLEDLRNMRATEAATTEPATKEDKVVVDMDIFLDNVLIEGGSTKDHGIYLSEDSYVPGLTEKLLGVKKGDKPEFELEIPKTHYSKMLAGKKPTFKIEVKEIFKRTLPELNNDFASGLGAKDVDDLKNLLKENITKDKQAKEADRATGEMIDAIIEKTKFGEIPDVLIESEKQRLFAEFKQRLDEQGIPLEQYLTDVKKSVEDIAEGFSEQALKKTKASLAYRELAKTFEVKIDDKELELEKEKVRSAYQDHPNIEDKLKDPDILDYIMVNLRNRKITDLLREKLIASASAKPEKDSSEEKEKKDKKQKKEESK